MVTAQEILESTAFTRCCEAVRTDLLDELQSTAPGDGEALRAIAYKLWALRDIKAELGQQAIAETRAKG